jgi:hypothetical protein
MNKTILFWFLVSLAGAAQVTDPRVIVDLQFPQTLLHADADFDQVSCFTVFDSLPDGTPQTIIAAYSNNFEGTVQAIQRQKDGSYQVMDEPSGFVFGGSHCSVEQQDVDGDGFDEIKVTFVSVRAATSDWIFKWDGRHLHNIGPTARAKSGKLRSLLSVTDFVDIYHDGTLQALSGSPPADKGHLNAPNFLYKLVNGVYVFDAPILYWQSFSRTTGSPDENNDSLDTFQGSRGPYVIKVINGTPSGEQHVSSAHVIVNGAEVIGPSRFEQQTAVITATVNTLKTKANSIQVQLEGPPGGQISVLVEDHSPQFANGPR